MKNEKTSNFAFDEVNPSIIKKFASRPKDEGDAEFGIDFEQFEELANAPRENTSYSRFVSSIEASKLGLSSDEVAELADIDEDDSTIFTKTESFKSDRDFIKFQDADEKLVDVEEDFLDGDDPVVIANRHLKSRKQIKSEIDQYEQIESTKNRRKDIALAVKSFAVVNKDSLIPDWTLDAEFVQEVAEIISLDSNYDLDEVISVITSLNRG